MYLSPTILKAAAVVGIASFVVRCPAIGLVRQALAFARVILVSVETALIVSLGVLAIPVTLLILAIFEPPAVKLHPFAFHRAESPGVIGRGEKIITGFVDGSATRKEEKQKREY